VRAGGVIEPRNEYIGVPTPFKDVPTTDMYLHADMGMKGKPWQNCDRSQLDADGTGRPTP
jgi:hypothetical protein